MPKIKLLVADDHLIVRDGIVSLLQEDPALSVDGVASTGQEVITLAAKQDYDVCLLDINMPGMDGLQASRILKEQHPDLKIIILTTYDDREIITELLHIGVSGYLLKNSDKQELVEAIQKVMKGRHYFSQEVETIILDGITAKKSVAPISLTERELQVVQLLAKEYTNDKIAEELHISFRTVETHRKNIMQKTKAHNLAGLLKFAYSNGLITE